MIRRKRRLKKSIRRALAIGLGLLIGTFYAIGINSKAQVTNITVDAGTTIMDDYGYFKNKDVIKVTLPTTLLQIGYSTFEGCDSLKSINLPEGLTVIDNRAFAQCESLTDVKLPITLVTLGNASFYGCNSLESIEIPEKIYRLDNNLFYGCTGLKEVIIPDSVTEIGQQTFCECTSLTGIELPDSLEKIDDGAFYNCIGLESISIPESVSFIGTDAFEGCAKLKIEAVPGSYAEQYARENGLLAGEETEESDDLEEEKVFEESDVPATGVTDNYNMWIAVLAGVILIRGICLRETHASDN